MDCLGISVPLKFLPSEQEAEKVLKYANIYAKMLLRPCESASPPKNIQFSAVYYLSLVVMLEPESHWQIEKFTYLMLRWRNLAHRITKSSSLTTHPGN